MAEGGKNAKKIKAEIRKVKKEQKVKGKQQQNKRRGRNAQIAEEWDDLAKEERLYKKLRRGKITQEQFDEQMDGS